MFSRQADIYVCIFFPNSAKKLISHSFLGFPPTLSTKRLQQRGLKNNRAATREDTAVSCVEDPASSARRHQTPEQPGRRLAASGKGPDGKDKRGQLRSQENSDVGRRRERLVGNKLRKITAWGGTDRSRPPACSPRQPRTEVLEVRRLQSGAVF